MLRAILWLSDTYRRLLGIVVGLLGPGYAYRYAGALARVVYHSFEEVRARTEAQCRAALGQRVDAADVPRIGEESFVHRIWNLTDLMLADRRLHAGTFQRYGGQIPAPYLQMLREAVQNRRPLILLSAYYGPFDLLPVFLGFNGIQAAVVYRPHRNRRFDEYRNRIRARGGCRLIPVSKALAEVPEVLGAGGTVALVADHHTDGRGVAAQFLGLPTTAPRTVGLLAEHYQASVAVAGIRRSGAFRFEIAVGGILGPQEWSAADEPAAFITRWYLRTLEGIILTDPAQYLWSYARWGETIAEGLIDGQGSPP